MTTDETVDSQATSAPSSPPQAAAAAAAAAGDRLNNDDMSTNSLLHAGYYYDDDDDYDGQLTDELEWRDDDTNGYSQTVQLFTHFQQDTFTGLIS